MARVVSVFRRGATRSSRRAAIGSSREAFLAGRMADITVTPTPTIRATTIVRACSVGAAVGRAIPNASKAALSATAIPKPTPIPTMDASVPITTASVSTIRFTCRAVAPRALSRASSLVRWVTVMRKVLAMMNVPTNTAMKPKVSRKVLKKASPSWISPACSSAAV